MKELWRDIALNVRFSDVVATIAIFLSLFTLFNTRAQNKRTRALVLEEKRTALLRTLDLIHYRIVEGIARLARSQALTTSEEQRTLLQAFRDQMNKNASKITAVRDAVKKDSRSTEVELEARAADYESAAQSAEDVMSTANELIDNLS